MDKEHVKGTADQITGKTKEIAGRATGDRELEAEGHVDQVKGAARKALGDLKDAGRNAIDSLKHEPSTTRE